MILVLVLGGVLGWVVQLAHVQRDDVAAIRHGGGPVSYDLQLKSLPGGGVRFDRTGRPKAPKWLIDYLGHDFFGHVENVELGPRNLDEVLKQVEHLDNLRRIHFFRGIDLTPMLSAGMTALPNAGLSRFQGLVGLFTMDLSPPQFNGRNLKYLKNMTRLDTLNLPDDSSVTDADLTYLIRLTALSMLELHDPRITDLGLASLKDMSRLKILRLSGTQVTGAGLRSLHAMTGLKVLDLGSTRVDDLAPIGHLTLLTNLNLDDTRITDVTLRHLSGMPGLRSLSLRNTAITDRGLGTLTECKALKTLNVRGTKISSDGLRAFRKDRPYVKVVH